MLLAAPPLSLPPSPRRGDSGGELGGALLAPAQPGRLRLGFTERGLTGGASRSPALKGHIGVPARSLQGVGPLGDSPAGVGASGAAPGSPRPPTVTCQEPRGSEGPRDVSPGTPEPDPQAGTVGQARSSGGAAGTPTAPQSCPWVPGVARSPRPGGHGSGGRPGAAAAAVLPSRGPREAEGSQRPFPSSLPLCHLRHWHSRQKRA